MFAAIAENPEFWRNKIKLFVAMAPAVFIEHLPAKAWRDISVNEFLINLIRSIGPEVLSHPIANTEANKLITHSSVGNYIN